jgi:glyoxylase-like metal-dependent hydrolase (beta-lactamase superfamily II)
MDKIPIGDSDVVSLDHVAAGVIGLHVLVVNLFAVSHEGGSWTLIDAGLPMTAGRIRSWAEKHFGEQRPRAILQTHGHFDHVGGLQELAEHWNVPVFAHPLEMPYLTGQKSYPRPDPTVGGGLMAVMSPLYPRDPIDLGNRVRPFPLEDRMPDLPGWRIIHTPGHTEGHVSFFRDTDRTLIVGDAFTTTQPESVIAVLTQRPELHGPPAYYTQDWDEAKNSVEKLAELRPVTVAPGHGQPLSGADVAEALYQLAINFDRVGRPERSRSAEPKKPAA